MNSRRLLIFCFALTLIAPSGCGPLLGAQRADQSFFVLIDDGKVSEQTFNRYPLHLLIRDTKANSFINSHKIIFSEETSTRGYYQFARWVEPPPDRFTLLLIDRLERAEIFNTVSRLASSSLGDIQLNTEITEFYHNIDSMPGEVVIRVNAEVLNLGNRKKVLKKNFSKKIEVESYSASGAVDAFSIAVNQLLDEMLTWVSEAVPLVSVHS